MKLAQTTTFAAILSASCLASVTGEAAVIYNNLGATPNGADAAQAFGPLFDSFSTDDAAVLTGISLLLDASDPTDGGTFTISLFSDSSASPGSAIGSSTFSDALLSGSPAAFSEVASFSLSPDTRYWIGLSSTGSVDWSFSGDVSGPGVAGEFFANSTGVFPSVEGPYQMELTTNGTGVVPEASTWAMMLLGFISLGFAADRASRKGSALA